MDRMDEPATLGDVRAAAQAIKMLVLLSTSSILLVVGWLALELGAWVVSSGAVLVAFLFAVLVYGKMYHGPARTLVGYLDGHHARPPLDEQRYSNGDRVLAGGED